MRMRERRYVRRMPKIYGNLQPQTPRPTASGLTKGLKRLLPVLIVAAAVYGLLMGPMFHVKTVDVRGTSFLSKDAVANDVPLGVNVWFLPTSDIEQAIRRDNPIIEEVHVLRGLPSSALVEVTERTSEVFWITGNTGSVLDENGTPYLQYHLDTLANERPEVQQAIASLPRIVDTSGLGATIGQTVTSLPFMQFVRGVADAMGQVLPTLGVDHFEVGATTYTAALVTKSGLRVLLNTLDDPGVQVRNLARLNRDGKLQGAHTVDLRVDRWAYVS